MTLESPHQQSGRITRSSSSASSWSRYTDSMKAYVRRRRLWLSLLGVVVLIGVIVGVVLTSHYYFHLFGGQGYMRRRRRWPDSDNVCLASKADLFLPMRPTSRITYAPNRAERTVPFDGCGDQMNSCEAFDQPEICCPVTMACQRTKYTTSGIFCCNATGLGCKSTAAHPPKCLPGMFECSKTLRGGCCPDGWLCDRSGCVQPELSPTFTSTSTTTTTSTTTSTISNNEQLPSAFAESSDAVPDQKGEKTNAASGSHHQSKVQDIPSINTPGASTAMQPKTGEVASRGSAIEAMKQLLMILPGSLLSNLFVTALVLLIL